MSALPDLVDAAWLAEHVTEVRVVDVRWYLGGPPGIEAYLAGHIPGAVFLDVDTDLSAPASPEAGRHPLPTPDDFAAALGRVGIGPGDPVVAYDDRGGSTAARLWWMLRALGEPAAVLDGGLPTWTGGLSSGPPELRPVRRAARPWPAELFVDADAVSLTSAAVLDARTADRYAWGDADVDPRPGHVPGAVSAPWTANLDPGTGRFLPPDALRARYESVGKSFVAYCGSGVTACHDLLALRLAGFDDIALYPGSWSQWGNDPSRPVDVGP